MTYTMEFYKISNIIIQIIGDLKVDWQKYLCHRNIDSSEIDIEINYCREIYKKYSIFGYDICQSKYCYKYMSETMFVDQNWEKIYILPLNCEANISIFTNQIFYTHAVQRHMIQIHSSMIEYSGNGLLFLGPSGIGKTTMAELWNKYRGALIINGDMNFVQETDECFLGWGTPWHGSSPYCENTSVPIKALIVLKQAPENSIRELKDFEKVQLVSNNIIYPTWLEKGMELCLETLNHLLSALPVYELSCRPDEEAVRLTEEAVFGGSA